MADSYAFVKGGKLNLKGHKKSKKHKSKKRKHDESPGPSEIHNMSDDRKDAAKHGGWWEVKRFNDISSNIVIEMKENCYMAALDNGGLTLGPCRDEGEPPDPTEIFTAIKVSDTKVAFKSGYGKYLAIEADGRIVGRSDAMGSKEQFEPVFQDGKVALNGCNNCFISFDEDDDDIVCMSSTAGEREFVKLRSNANREIDPLADIPLEERGSVKSAEVNYVKKFQSFQDRRLRVSEGDKSQLKKAKKEGDFHEVMLDRREKMKADRYCK